MTSKITNDVLYNEIMHVKEHTQKIETHLEQLNSKVATNIEAINDNEKEVAKINVKMQGLLYIVGTAASVITAVFTAVLVKIFGGK